MVQRQQQHNRWNPFSSRARELAHLGDSAQDHMRRVELETELLMAEAAEAAAGGRHLAIVHGDPDDLAATEHLAEFYDVLRVQVADAEQYKLRTEPDHVIVTTSGLGAQEAIDQVANTARIMNPCHWRITRTAVPDLTPPISA